VNVNYFNCTLCRFWKDRPTFFKISSFMLQKRKIIKQVCNDMRVRKWWQNYPMNLDYCSRVKSQSLYSTSNPDIKLKHLKLQFYSILSPFFFVAVCRHTEILVPSKFSRDLPCTKHRQKSQSNCCITDKTSSKHLRCVCS